MIAWAKLPKNDKGRDFVVGDIHGEFDKVDELLLQCKFDDEQDRLVCVGDLIDRGSQNEEVTDWLDKDWFFSVMGNHEHMLTQAVFAQSRNESDQAARMHAGNGGEWFYDLSSPAQQKIANYLHDLPVALEVETSIGLVGFIHADVPGYDWADVRQALTDGTNNSLQKAIWGRDRIRAKDRHEVANVTKVFVGHTPVKFTHMLGNVQFVDTGACFPDGFMTMIEIATGEVFTVK